MRGKGAPSGGGTMPAMDGLLIYGAYGYTGELIARRAVERGLQPILAGRGPERLGRLADELECDTRTFQLQDPTILEARFGEVKVVLNCAGPFSRTFRPVSEACLATGTHYLDITGEIDVFESLARRDDTAREAGVMLLPGVGFDVVPSDCLALHLKELLPDASHLVLGIDALDRVSRGTALTAVENLHRRGRVRRDGRLVEIATGTLRRRIDFGEGGVTCASMPWGDLSTAFHSTGIPNIEVYLAVRGTRRLLLPVVRWLGPLLGTRPMQAFLRGRAQGRRIGPSPEERARSVSRLWGEVTTKDGRRCTCAITTPEGYDLTAAAAVAAAERALAGEAPPGFQTPAKAFGADFVLGLDGVEGWIDG